MVDSNYIHDNFLFDMQTWMVVFAHWSLQVILKNLPGIAVDHSNIKTIVI
jgi:hypothetical protein